MITTKNGKKFESYEELRAVCARREAKRNRVPLDTRVRNMLREQYTYNAHQTRRCVMFWGRMRREPVVGQDAYYQEQYETMKAEYAKWVRRMHFENHRIGGDAPLGVK